MVILSSSTIDLSEAEKEKTICRYVKALLHRNMNKWKRHLIDRETKTDYTYVRSVSKSRQKGGYNNKFQFVDRMIQIDG